MVIFIVYPRRGFVPIYCVKPFLEKISILSKPPSPQCRQYFDPNPVLDLWKFKALLEIHFPLPSLSCALSPAIVPALYTILCTVSQLGP